MYQGLSLIDWLTCTPCRGLNFKGGGGGGEEEVPDQIQWHWKGLESKVGEGG